jgi:transcriptional regulator with XRE-family HTH domain
MKTSGPLTKAVFSKKLGGRIRELREKKGISLREFELLDKSIDRHALSKIENGITVPSVFTLYRIAKIVDVQLGDFFKNLKI